MIRLGISHFIRALGINLILIVQVILMFVLTGFTTSLLEETFRFYSPVSDLLSKNGVYTAIGVNSEYPMDTKFPQFLLDSDDVKENLVGVSDMILTYQSNIYIGDTPRTMRTYDHDFLKEFRPQLYRNSKWLGETEPLENTLDVVVSVNADGMNIGDVFETRTFDIKGNEFTIKLRVIGIFKEGSKLFGGTEWAHKDNYMNLYEPYSFEQEEEPIILADVAQCEMLGVEKMVIGKALITFADDISEQDAKSNNIFISKYGPTMALSDMQKRSQEQLNIKLMMSIPMMVGMLLILSVSIVSASAIGTKLQLRNFGIYFLCGATWNQNLMTSAINTIVILIFSNIAAILSINWLSTNDVFTELSVTFTPMQGWAMAALSILIFGMSLFMPFIILRKHSPNEIIKQL